MSQRQKDRSDSGRHRRPDPRRARGPVAVHWVAELARRGGRHTPGRIRARRQSAGQALPSDPAFFRNESPSAPAWAPPEVLRLNPRTVLIWPDEAAVGFGDAWHEFSYGLSRERSADTATEDGWKLELFNGGYPGGGRPGRRLMTFTLNQADYLDQHAFIDQALKEYRRRFTLPNQDYYDVHSRLIFLLKFNEVELARQSIRDFAADNPTDWTDQLLLWTIDHQVNPAAAKQLEAVDRMGDASAWLLVAGNVRSGRRGAQWRCYG